MKKQARHDGKKLSGRLLKRDKAFLKELAREWDVEQVPRSCREKLEQTFESLPQELVVRPRFWRSFRRGAAVAATVCAVCCVFLFLLNLRVPQFTESLPGLGGAFHALNQWLSEQSHPEGEELPRESMTEEPSLPVEGEFLPLPVEDNGTVLNGFSWNEDTGELTLGLTIPYMGRFSYSLLGYNSPTRLGTCVSITVDGEENFLDKGVSLGTEDEESLLYADGRFQSTLPLEENAVQLEYYGGVSRSQAKGPVVVTLYAAYNGPPNSNFGQMVTAEFTLDLQGGTAKVSEHYKEKPEPLKKLSPDQVRTFDWKPEFTGDWLASNAEVYSREMMGGDEPGHYDSYYRLEFFGKTELYPPLVLNCYFNDDLVVSVTNHHPFYDVDGSVTVSESGTFLNEYIQGQNWYMDGNGAAWIDYLTDPSRTGKEYRRVVFAVPSILYGIEDGYDNAYTVWETGSLRFELVDSQTGKVLIHDARAAAEAAIEDYLARCRPGADDSSTPGERQITEERGPSFSGASDLSSSLSEANPSPLPE